MLHLHIPGQKREKDEVTCFCTKGFLLFAVFNPGHVFQISDFWHKK